MDVILSDERDALSVCRKRALAWGGRASGQNLNRSLIALALICKVGSPASQPNLWSSLVHHNYLLNLLRTPRAGSLDSARFVFSFWIAARLQMRSEAARHCRRQELCISYYLGSGSSSRARSASPNRHPRRQLSETDLVKYYVFIYVAPFSPSPGRFS